MQIATLATIRDTSAAISVTFSSTLPPNELVERFDKLDPRGKRRFLAIVSRGATSAELPERLGLTDVMPYTGQPIITGPELAALEPGVEDHVGIFSCGPFAEISDAQGWDTPTDLSILVSFIKKAGLEKQLVEFAAGIAAMENGEEVEDTEETG